VQTRRLTNHAILFKEDNIKKSDIAIIRVLLDNIEDVIKKRDAPIKPAIPFQF